MKQGLALRDLAAEVQRQAEMKRDFKADTPSLGITSNGKSTLTIDGIADEFTVGDIAHSQIATRLGIPRKYYDRLRDEHPVILDQNINGLWSASKERRMIRTLDGTARAYLSDRYRPLDNDDLLGAVLPILADEGGDDLRIESCQVTDSRLYLKAVFPRIEQDVALNDPVQAGLVISNSEVGMGALAVQPMIYRLVCLNGMISADYSQRRAHLGRASGEDGAFEIYRDETLQADDKALWMKVQDTVRGLLNDDTFTKIVERMRESMTEKLDDPIHAVEELAKKASLGEQESRGVLRHLIEGGDLSRYGLMNAVTRASQEVADYDRATDMEALGGRVLSLPAADWQRIAVAT